MLDRRKSRTVRLAVIVCMCALLGVAQGYSGVEHAWLGIQSWDYCGFWQTMDPAFHHELTKIPEGFLELHDQNMLKKFYLIGCMLPDLFTREGISTSRWVVQSLHGQTSLPDKCPLDIYEATYEQVAAADSFVWNDDRPNDNLPALRKMVDYAKQQNWSPWEKALIYGAYAHVVMDLHAGCFQEPSLWGKDFVLEPPEARWRKEGEEADVLEDAEMHGNFFEPTYVSQIQGDAWMRTMLVLYSEFEYQGYPSGIVTKYGACQFYRKYDADGRNHKAWQDTLFLPEQRFVDAVQATDYDVDNLTPERLHAYLHGYGIMWFLIAGYPRGHSEQAGGVYSHPDWNFIQISDYFLNIGSENAFPWVMSDLGSVVKEILKKLLLRLLSVVGQVYQGVMRIWYPDLQLFQPWTWYLQEGTNLQNWYYALVPLGLGEEVWPFYSRMSSYISQWSSTSRAPGADKPNMRSAYRDEPAVTRSLMPEMRENVRQGPSYLSHAPRTLARKAGLVGGMWGQGDVVYRQPGVVDLSFRKGGDPCYATLDVPQSGDPNYAQLSYDILPFANQVRLGVVGKTNPSDPGQEFAFASLDNRAYRRSKGAVQFNLTQMASQGVTRVSFTMYNGSPLQLMLNSDYEGAYNADPRISGNQLYQVWLNNGTAGRNPGQNPFTDPKHFWPYVLRLNPIPGYYLSPPVALSASMNSNPPTIHVEWTDCSACEDAYEIERTIDRDPGQVTTFVVPGDSGRLGWLDPQRPVGHHYGYRVRARLNSQWWSEWTDGVEITLTYSDSVEVTAFNNASKSVISGSQVHVTYFGQTPSGAEKVVYLHSSNGGVTWDPLEQVSPDNILGLFPSVAVSSSGEPYILWAERWRWYGTGMDGLPHWYITYNASWKENGLWRNVPVARIDGDGNYSAGPPTGFVPPQASFVVCGDSGYLALAFRAQPRITTQEGVYYSAFPLRAPSYVPSNMLRLGAPSWGSPTPTVLVDKTGRKIVTHWLQGNYVRLWYKEATGSQFQEFRVMGLGNVWNMTATIENGSNVLLAWTSTTNIPGDVQFARVVRQIGGGYQLDGGRELVDNNLSGPDGGIRPRFAGGSFGMPLLVYEHGGSTGSSIWYAVRAARNVWDKGAGFVSDAYGVSFPQACYAGSRMTIFCTGTVYYYPPPVTRRVLLTGSVTLAQHQIPPNAVAQATGPNSGRMLAVQPGGEVVHVVYDGGEFVQYIVSQDGGETWGEPSQIDFGDHPSIALSAAGLPTIVYSRHDSVFCKVRRPDSTWREMTVFAGDIAHAAGPPAVSEMFSIAGFGSAYCAFPVYDLNLNSSQVWLAKLDTLQVQLEPMAETTGALADSFVSIACTPGGPFHIAWQRADRVMCVTDSMPSGPFGGSDAQPTLVQVSTQPAGHPFIEAYGDLLYVVWRDQQSGAVVRTYRHVWDALNAWVLPTSISGSADFPACSKSGVTAWQQPDYCGQGDIWANVCGPTYNLSESPNVSSAYPHLDVGLNLNGPTPVVDTIYSIWTENVDESLYGVRFRKRGVQGTDGLPPTSPTHVLFSGRETVSTYCLFRSGRDSSRGVGFDYGNDSLSYRMRYMDPRFNYLAEFTLAHNKRLFFEQSVRARGEEIARVRFGPNKPDTVRLVIPRRFYENGATLPFSLRRLTGEYASLAGLKLYAFDPRRARPGGAMAGVTPILLEPRLYDAAPCPSRGATILRYQIPRPTHVTLKIYDASGRSVRTVLDSKRPAGVYTVVWDGRDQRGRMSPNGIYFCRMKAGVYKDGKKLVISR